MRSSYWLSLTLALGLVCTWVGERVVEGSLRTGFTGLGVAFVLLALALRVPRLKQARPEASKVEQQLLALDGVVVLALALYAAQSDGLARVTGSLLEASHPVLAGVLAAAWPALMACALLPLLLVELAYEAVARAPKLELGRIAEARNAGLGLAFTLVFAFSLQYVASERDAKRDFSYFRVTRPGEATLKLAASLDEKLTVTLFFPPGNDVAELVAGYFDDVRAQAPQLEVQRLDQALEPVKAKELGVSGNGIVVIQKGKNKETLYVGTDLEKARGNLRGLDGDVQRRLLQVGKAKRTIYFTAGHGERTREATMAGDLRAPDELMHRVLQDQNFEVRVLTTAEGLGQEVPHDASAVFIIGPSEAFTEPEAQALKTYGEHGGKLFIALDPENGKTFDELLSPLGLTFRPETLVNDKVYAHFSSSVSLADRANLGVRAYTSHPVVTNLSKAQAPVVLLRAGVLEEKKQHPAELSVDLSVRAPADTWNDLNGNYQPDSPPEQRMPYAVVAAVTKRAPSNKVEDELRAVVLADSDVVADVVLAQVQGNQALLLDGFKWLLGEERLSGITNTEADVPLMHTRQQDTAVFYGTTFLAPLLVVGVGFVVRRRQPKAKKAQEARS
jgi:hypothetical protein